MNNDTINLIDPDTGHTMKVPASALDQPRTSRVGYIDKAMFLAMVRTQKRDVGEDIEVFY